MYTKWFYVHKEFVCTISDFVYTKQFYVQQVILCTISDFVYTLVILCTIRP